MSDQPRILCWVQNLLGSGHLKRQLLIAAAAVRAGCPMMIVSGGPPGQFAPPHGVDWVQLPPLQSRDSSFAELVDCDGMPVTDAYWRERQRLLMAATSRFRPDIVMTEMYPFGRRKFRRELLPWLDTLDPHMRITCSLRDILVSPKKIERVAETVAIVRERYDRVLVHSDPAIQQLADTFQLSNEIAHKLVHTGYVVDADRPSASHKRWQVCLSVGSGIVGQRLIETAIECHRDMPANTRPWLIVTGRQAADPDLRRWRASAGSDIVIERFRADLPEMIASADLSISQAGYNTIVETLHAGTPMLLVPFETATEDEQIKRAQKIAALGRAVVLREHDLSVAALSTAMAKARALTSQPMTIDLDGAANTVNALIELHRGGRA